MKYYFCKLHASRPTFAQDMTPAEAQLMKQHGAYLHGFLQNGQAVAFGPVADPKGYFGIGLFELPDNADINGICAHDPVILAGTGFRYEILPMPMAMVRPRAAS
ncbi:MAG: YciI family protein [Opitutales bacterium]